MKTWEMIKELMENTNKRFVSDKGTKVEMIAYSDGDNLRFEYSDGERVYSIDLGRVWEEVKQPIPWQDAIQAYAEHGKIFSIRMNGVEVFRQAEGCKLGINGDETSTVYLEPYIDPSYILKGEWYIED